MSGEAREGEGGPLQADAVVHVVDDDPAIRDSLAFLFRSRGIATVGWESGEAFLAGDGPEAAACVVLDVRMDGLGGLATFDRLRAAGSSAPVVFLTGHADVPIAVEALKKGAFDFVEKPFNDNVLVDTVIKAVAEALAARAADRSRSAVEGRIASLTQREREVMDLMLDGRLNKQIADALGVTMRTVEVHRARVLEKMGARNAVDLANVMGGLGRRGGG
ncbi:response regulator transcription factor [Mongoliimonas terrestris]|uniref:response regulator transcription factor n=1 Tax=Mongoliimonas terrestris TaxID=1709001 RepID=UPI000B2F922A|nr:response regulator [Mongoliimonas terrestris]